MWSGNSGDPNYGFLPSNPFLAMLIDLEGDEQQQQQVEEEGEQEHEQQQAPLPPSASASRAVEAGAQTGQVPAYVPPAARTFKLPPFWDHAPDMWFCRAEFRFEVASISGERDKFAHVVDALSYEALKLVKDLLMSPPADRPYTKLKERILMATQLTPVQMAIKLMAAPDMGDRRPTALLASLMEHCPPGEENTAFFRAAFILRLPADIRAHLDGLETGDLKDLAAKADRHWLNRSGGQKPVAAACQEGLDFVEEVDPVAAVSKQQGGGQFFRGGRGGRGGNRGAGGRGGGRGGGQGGWERLVQFTICRRHQKFGQAAHSCGDPANCQFEKLGN